MGVLEDLPISDCKCTSFGAIRSIYIELRHHKDELLKGTTGGNRRIPRWRSLIIHRETKKFFGTLKSFFRSFISFFRSFISSLRRESSFSRELLGKFLGRYRTLRKCSSNYSATQSNSILIFQTYCQA